MRLVGPDGQGTIAIIGRPFAVIGRALTADLPIASRDASLRHVYLHLNHQGVFAVDLATRTGTRFDDAPLGSRACWLRPGRGFELAGHRIELLEPAPEIAPEAGTRIDPLRTEAVNLCPLELWPEDDPEHPVSLLSELSFLGRSRACVIRAKGDDVARVHAVLVRSASGGFAINLAGSGLTVNHEPAALAVPLRDGDRLGLGRRRYLVRLGLRDQSAIAASPTVQSLAAAAPPAAWAAPLPSVEPGAANINQALRAVRDGQDDLIRTNDQFQWALITAVRQLYQEQTALFERHLERLDRLQHEVAELRAELRERLGPSPLLPPAADRSTALPPPTRPPLDVPQASTPPDSGRATSWLIDRLGELEEQVEQESRSGWKDLLSRLGTPLRPRDEVEPPQRPSS